MPYLDSAAGPGRVVIISASVGAGHDGAAAELARGLASSGVPVSRYDFIDLLPARIGTLLSGGYHQLLDHAPSVYQRIYATTEHGGAGGRIARTILRMAESRTLRALPADTEAVVSTYPLASQVLGALRRDGRLAVPAFTYLTDFSVHPMWVAEGIDTHLALHSIPLEQARDCGAARVLASGPVVDPRFHPATDAERRAARTRFGLPQQAPLALLVAGSWGVGPVERTATEVRDCGAAVPVVVCGRNQALADRLRAAGIDHVLGWVDDMPGLMHAADVLVQNAGGLTSLEAFASGLPVASYGCIPGHGRTNAAALDQAGLASWIRSHEDLKPVLVGLLDGPLGHAQRAAARALFDVEEANGPVSAIRDALRPATPNRRTPASRPSARSTGRRAAVLLAVAAVGTLLPGTQDTEEDVARDGENLLHTFSR